MGLSKQNNEFFLEPLKIKRRKVAVQSDWKNKNSGNFQNLYFLLQLETFFKRKSCFFSDIPKGSKFAKECDWNNKVSQSNEILGFS